MTEQEIQRFVNQPTPRNVPKNIFRAAVKHFRCKIMKNYTVHIYFFVIAIMFLLVFILTFIAIMRDMFDNQNVMLIIAIFTVSGFYLFERWRLKRFLANARYASGIIVETD